MTSPNATPAPLTPEREAEIREWRDELGKRKDFAAVGPYTALLDTLAELDRLRARVTELETAAAAGLKSLSSFIFDSTDPGTAALGAQWLLAQAMPQVDDPFAEPNRYRTEVVAEFVEKVAKDLGGCCDECDACIDIMRHHADDEDGTQ